MEAEVFRFGITWAEFLPLMACVVVVEVARFFIKPVTDKRDHAGALRNVIVVQFAVILCLLIWLVWAVARLVN